MKLNGNGGVLGTFACAMALCVALAGCGGASDTAATGTDAAGDTSATEQVTTDTTTTGGTSGAAADATDPADAIPGTWEPYAMSNGEQTLSLDDADLDDETRAAFAETQYWVFDADGTATMVDKTQDFEQSCTWELGDDGTTITLTYTEGDISMPIMTATYDGESIEMKSEGITIWMRKRA